MTEGLRRFVEDFEVGATRAEPLRHRLDSPNGAVVLEPKVMQALCCLADRAGEVVTREELLQQVWARQFGSDESLTRAVSILRRTLGRDSIETIPKVGYRLTLPVRAAAPDPATGRIAREAYDPRPEDRRPPASPARVEPPSAGRNDPSFAAGAAIAGLLTLLIVALDLFVFS